MLDLIIRNGLIIDGTGKKAYKNDIGINGEFISTIGALNNIQAKNEINADGLVIAPGFIDAHAHSDGILLYDSQHANGIRQGITTEILGQDGLSYAPLSNKNYKIQRQYLNGILGSPPENLNMKTVKNFKSNYHKKISVNTAYPIPHSALRLETVGFKDKPLIDKDLEQAKNIIAEGMQQGAIGLATGMSYHPNAWSTTEELIELCKVVAQFNGVYITHLRDVNRERGFGNGGIPEALEIGRKSSVKVHFSHTRTDKSTAGKIEKVVGLIDKSKNEVDSTLDIYPYPTGSTFLTSLLPSFVHEGGPSAILQNIQNPTIIKKIIEYYQSNELKMQLDLTTISYSPKTPQFEKFSIADISKKIELPIWETICQLLIKNDLAVGFWINPPSNMALWEQLSKDSLQLLSRPDYMVGTDSIPLGSIPHPRAYGTFPRFLGRLRRKYNTLNIEQMIQRMTQNPAKRFGLNKRGALLEGNYADLVIFDQDQIIDTATYDNPKQFPIGIPYVVINGEIAVNKEVCTGSISGQAIP